METYHRILQTKTKFARIAKAFLLLSAIFFLNVINKCKIQKEGDAGKDHY